MIDKVDGLRIGNDLNYYLIEMWRSLQSGWIPPDTVTEAEYQYYKKCQDLEDPALVAFIGFCCSHSGMYFTGYARCKKGRNYAAEGKRNILKQLPKMLGVELYNLNYFELEIPPNSIIYCDPPYQNTAGYKDGLDHTHFWQWCRDMSLKGHEVYISEYNAPSDFRCLIGIPLKSGLNKSIRVERVEKLFMYEPLF